MKIKEWIKIFKDNSVFIGLSSDGDEEGNRFRLDASGKSAFDSISKAATMLKEGEIFPTGIVRNRKKGLKRLIDQTKAHFEKIGESPDDYQIVVGYGYSHEEAVEFRDQLLASLKGYSNYQEIGVSQIGATIGVHTGPHPLGIGLLKKYDR